MEYGASFGMEDFTMPLLFVLPELFIPWLSIPPRISGVPLSLAPTEPLGVARAQWQRGWGESGEGRGAPS